MIDFVSPVPTLEYVRARRTEILQAATRRQITNVRVFGSVARGDARPESDVDFVVDLPSDARGFAAFGLLDELREELKAILGHPVDVVTSRGPFSPRGAAIDEEIKAEAQEP